MRLRQVCCDPRLVASDEGAGIGSAKLALFEEVMQECLDSALAKLVIWGVVAALIYHSLAGIKHVIMDFGIGETMEGGVTGARIVIGLSIVLILIAGVWIW